MMPNARTITLLLAIALAAHVHGQEAGAESTTMELTCTVPSNEWIRLDVLPGWLWEDHACTIALIGMPTLVVGQASRHVHVAPGTATLTVGAGNTIIYDRGARTISRCSMLGAGGRSQILTGVTLSSLRTPGACRTLYRDVDDVEPTPDDGKRNAWRVVKTTVEYGDGYMDTVGDDVGGAYETRTTTIRECWIEWGAWRGCGEGED